MDLDQPPNFSRGHKKALYDYVLKINYLSLLSFLPGDDAES